MSKSNAIGPGAYDESNGSTTQLTDRGAKPSCFATAYATALSNPLPFAGLLFSKYGGYAGESVATVSTPLCCTDSEDFVHVLAAADVVEAAELELEELLPHAASSPALSRPSRDAGSRRCRLTVSRGRGRNPDNLPSVRVR
jgi:hypothetical protein